MTTSLASLWWMETAPCLELCQGTQEKFYTSSQLISRRSMVWLINDIQRHLLVSGHWWLMVVEIDKFGDCKFVKTNICWLFCWAHTHQYGTWSVQWKKYFFSMIMKSANRSGKFASYHKLTDLNEYVMCTGQMLRNALLGIHPKHSPTVVLD